MAVKYLNICFDQSLLALKLELSLLIWVLLHALIVVQVRVQKGDPVSGSDYVVELYMALATMSIKVSGHLHWVSNYLSTKDRYPVSVRTEIIDYCCKLS